MSEWVVLFEKRKTNYEGKKKAFVTVTVTTFNKVNSLLHLLIMSHILTLKVVHFRVSTLLPVPKSAHIIFFPSIFFFQLQFKIILKSLDKIF